MRATASLLLTGAMLLTCVAAEAQTAPTTGSTPSSSGADQWTGVFAGADLGRLSPSLSGTEAFPINGPQPPLIDTFASRTPAAASSGGEVGYVSKLSQTLLLGFDVQLLHASVNGQGGGTGFLTSEDQTTLKSRLLTTIRARVGTPITERVLLYGTAGLAISRVTAEEAFIGVANGTAIETMSGPALGVGVEYAPWKRKRLGRVTIGAEFVHASLGRRTFTFQPTGEPPAGVVIPPYVSIDSHTNQFGVHVTYHLSAARR